MPVFTVVVDTAAPADRTFALLTDWPAHGRWIPFTQAWHVTPQGLPPAEHDRVGSVFVARTALGPVRFDDPMRITAWSRPQDGSGGAVALTKLGRVVRGEARVEVLPLTAGSSRVVWTERADVPPEALSARTGAPGRAVGRLLFGSALRRMAAELAAEDTALRGP